MRALPPDRIDLFYTRMSGVVDQGLLARYRAVLSGDELAKADRFKDRQARHLSLTARALIRYLIGEYTGMAPDAFSFVKNPHGKPELKPNSDVPELTNIRFNLSHCRGGVVCGICLGRDIGVDLENLGRRVTLAVADRFFSPAEASWVRKASGEAAQQEGFLDIWTLKEAYIKAMGGGLSIPLDSFSFDLSGPDVNIFFQAPGEAQTDWRFFRWWPDPGKIAAAAVRSPRPVKIRTFHCIPFKEIIDG